MRFKGWDRTDLEVPDPVNPSGRRTVRAIAPLIVSASRSTDIPAFYGDWFMRRLAAGYVTWRSPFGGDPMYVSFAKTRVFAFWSKDPAPFLQNLDMLDRSGYGYFFLFTLNNYGDEGLEPGIPPLSYRIRTFIQLSRRVGPGRILWRFDPLILSDMITVDDLIGRIRKIGDRIAPFTRRLIVSFIQIGRYRKVQRNLAAGRFAGIREFSGKEAAELASGLSELNRRWGLTLSACGGEHDFSRLGISRGQCIGYDLLRTEFSSDPSIRDLLSLPYQAQRYGSPDAERFFKDPGQRRSCGCMISKDIGQYSTCPHGCAYCYANGSVSLAGRNYQAHLRDAASGIYHESII